MSTFYTLASTIIISLLSLVGVFTLSFKPKFLNKFVMSLVSLSAGTMMGAVFFHLLPESHHHLGVDQVYQAVLISFLSFFVIEKILHWQHCHKPGCEVHSFGYMNLIGDGLHNFIDGLVIAGAYAADIRMGLITTIAVIAHELPQEIGDFGVLIHAGFSKRKALFFNLASALTAVIGALVGIFLLGKESSIQDYLLPIAAGGFLYISASDLLPEMRKEPMGKKLLLSALMFLSGTLLMLALTWLPFEH
ncbi:MAG: ZIP family metal transporter [Candidatus Pacebacteria bacterium]|jgi:zinc and cadmium transporter|nr:ZIP family metal transporter [Candidatus Paceibacterota bacterium]MBT3512328.1 ZIP family metal transporter [Candidatus Paceibacterota bacterium]MBT4004688.1 ZIP family metal transporter [Candidatus Paceibacterota bacterium]MBT4358393.1 ZIP family metal transporter [Candidatus Paceibacterota bacterium]MBT4680828.1 ZIP family metal transporter [Candidatus Paceibacterota bacterium]